MSEHLEMNTCLQEGVCAVFMGEGQIEIKTGGRENDDLRISWAEVWHKGEMVHRSAHAHSKKSLSALIEASEMR